jgi:UDP-N-acetylmuramate--alanine ligase
LVGIKGVAMTALAQCLLDVGKTVRGSDVAETFVTQPILDQRHILIDVGFTTQLPETTECVIYTAAHQAQENSQVVEARTRGLPLYSHAEALGQLFNAKKGIAVCGVGGKSTISAMIAWILEHTQQHPSYAVGVGAILDMPNTGHWSEQGEYFVAEADEYVTDPTAPRKRLPITPRFSYLKPHITVCTHLLYDHPDVYHDFAHTQKVFGQFFSQTQPGGAVITLQADKQHIQPIVPPHVQHIGVGDGGACWIDSRSLRIHDGHATAEIVVSGGTRHTLSLQLPGRYNLENALMAVTAAVQAGVTWENACAALATFRSTKRRFEHLGTSKEGVILYDDYAHHPRELSAVIAALEKTGL